MAVYFQMPFLYKAKGVPPRARNEREFAAWGIGTFGLVEVGAEDLAPSFLFANEDGDGPGRRYETPFLDYQGCNMLPLHFAAAREGRVTSESLRGLDRMSPRLLPHAFRPKETFYLYDHAYDVTDERKINPEKITWSHRDQVMGELQASLDASGVICEGQVYFEAPEPVMRVALSGDHEVRVEAVLRGKEDYYWYFPGERRDLAMDFATYLADETGRTLIEETDRSIELRTDLAVRTQNPIIQAARLLARRAELNISNVDYYGATVKRLGNAFLASPTLGAAFRFVEAFQEEAMKPEAHPLDRGRNLDNRIWFDAFWKAVELTPDEPYKISDPEPVEDALVAAEAPSI